MAANLLLEAGIAFTVVAAAGAAAWRLGQSVIPAYLIAGIVVGPHAPSVGGVPLTLVERSEFIDLFSELGIVFLLFFIGVEFSLGTLLAEPGRLLRAGGVDFAVNVAVGIALGVAFGFSPVEALFVAGIVYPSSSAVVTKSLIDLGWIADPEGEAVTGVLVFEDVVMAAYLAGLAVIAIGDVGGALVSLGESFALLVGFVLLATAGSGLVERVLDTRSDELFLLRVVGVTALLSGFALATGVSEAVAAFFVGAAVSESDLKGRLETVLAPARDLFAAVFFFAVGLATDPAAVAGVGPLLAVAVVATAAGKLASGYLGGRAYRLNPRRSVRTALALVARGEFSLVVAALAAALPGRLGSTLPAFAVGYVLVMSVFGTVVMRYSGGIERALGVTEAGSKPYQ